MRAIERSHNESSFNCDESSTEDSLHSDASDDDQSSPGEILPRKQAKVSAKGISKEEVLRRHKFLLNQSELFEHFIKNVLTNTTTSPKSRKQLQRPITIHRHQLGDKNDENEEEEEETNEVECVPSFTFNETPHYIKGGEMRTYQVHGLNWMIKLYENNINGILADEMIAGPHLIVVPKSTLQNWLSEFNRWVPGIDAFIFHGNQEERKELIKQILIPEKFDCCITSFEICMIEKKSLKKFDWNYLVVDEAHRLKNENSLLSKIVRLFDTKSRLLITGTPLQNNLHELWALLNFLLPDIFISFEEFDSWMNTQQSDQDQVVSQLRNLLSPFLLRRLKSDVEHTLLPKKEIFLYIGLSDLQQSLYKKILEKEILVINNPTGIKKESRVALQNIVMQLRKCSNHPYLFDGIEPGPPFTTDQHLINASRKLAVLDKLLERLKRIDSRVLVFSQMSRMLDILEDYCVWKGHEYCRIDGQTAHEDRIAAINEYNKENSSKFVFLLTTRAGGLGINLATADTVVIYDSDWNPQVDLQAQDRAHRIGQKKQVYIFRLVSEHTIEEKIIEKALQKLRLDQLVIQQGRSTNANKTLSSSEMLAMIHHGAQEILSGKENSDNQDNVSIEELIRLGEEKTKDVTAKYETAGLDDLQKFSVDSPSFDLTDGKKAGSSFKTLEVQTFKRERKAKTAADNYFNSVFGKETNATARTAPTSQKPPKPPKHPIIQDFQFYPFGLSVLLEKEVNYYRKTQNYLYPVAENETEEQRLKRLQDQYLIESAKPLTPAEAQSRDSYLQVGFSNWSKKDFQLFLKAIELYDRNEYELIAAETGKSIDEVISYSSVFWKNYHTLPYLSKINLAIQRGLSKREKMKELNTFLKAKISKCSDPLNELSFSYSTKASSFTLEEDRFLLVSMGKYGLIRMSDDTFDKIRDDIDCHASFRCNWHIRTRDNSELSRRCQFLLSVIEKEKEQQSSKLTVNSASRKMSKDLNFVINSSDATTSNSSNNGSYEPPSSNVTKNEIPSTNVSTTKFLPIDHDYFKKRLSKKSSVNLENLIEIN